MKISEPGLRKLRAENKNAHSVQRRVGHAVIKTPHQKNKKRGDKGSLVHENDRTHAA